MHLRPLSLALLLSLMLIVSACSGEDSDDETPAPEPTPNEETTPEETVPSTPEPTETEEPTETPTATEETTETPEPTEEESTPEPTEEEVSADFDDMIDQITGQVTTLRELEQLEDFDITIMTSDELRSMLEEETELDQQDVDLYWSMRLIENRDTDLRSLLIESQTDLVLGFYRIGENELAIIGEPDAEINATQRVTLAHEILHAIQDQHFDLDRFDDDNTDWDSQMAFSSVVEGDASLLEVFYLLENFSEQEVMDLLEEMMAEEESLNDLEAQLPPYVLESLFFPYVEGFNFVQEVFEVGGWELVNEALTNPPLTTQQILYPEKWHDPEQRDEPTEFEMWDFDDTLGGDWEMVFDGTLGVFDLRILLEENGATDIEVMENWDASEFVMYTANDQVLTATTSLWDSPEAAERFTTALIMTMDSYEREGDLWFDGEQYFTIVHDDNQVDLLSSTDADAINQVLDDILAEMDPAA